MRKNKLRNYSQFATFKNGKRESRYFNSDGSIKTSEGIQDGGTNHGVKTKLIVAYGDWLEQYKDCGWEVYLATIAFKQLAGHREAQITQMFKEIEWVYGRLVTRTIKKHRSPKWAAILPRAVFVADLPPPQHFRRGSRRSAWRLSPNDGLHVHGLLAANRLGRIRSSLDQHFRESRDKYVIGNILEIDIQPVTHHAAYAGQYGAKGLKCRRLTFDHVRVFPKTLGELTDRTSRRPDLIKDIQAVFNLSDEAAKNIYNDPTLLEQIIESRPAIPSSLPRR